MNLSKPGSIFALLSLIVFGNLTARAAEVSATPPNSIPSAARILERTKILSSDDFEGRAPGSPGEEKTVAYLIKEFKALGLQPGSSFPSGFMNFLSNLHDFFTFRPRTAKNGRKNCQGFAEGR